VSFEVSAVESSASFAAATRERWPEVDVGRCGAEQLPFPDGAFDAALAQLVVHFMADPVAGLGPAGDYVATLTQEHRDELRERVPALAA